jgi:hypothetical protein
MRPTSTGTSSYKNADYWLARSHRFDHLRREHDGRACVQVGSTWGFGALVRSVLAASTGAEAELDQAARRTEQLSFPQGPFSLAYTRFGEIWMRTEAGQLDRAAVLAADLIEQAERYGCVRDACG